MNFEKTKSFSRQLDKQDAIKGCRELFHYPKDRQGKELIYFCGNSLGLQPKKVSSYIEKELSIWAEKGVLGQDERWISYHEKLQGTTSRLVGALESEVVVMNALTVNIHLLLVSFYQPIEGRYKIIIEKDAFPSDRYAVESQIKFHGQNPSLAIVELCPRKGEKILREDDILSAINEHGDDLALVYLGGVNYYTGQALNMKDIAKAARGVGARVGFNLAHSVGNLPMSLHDWGIDFSAWCTYKYLCAGPGSPSGVFIHERHHDWSGPRFQGWWGHNKSSRFEMPLVFDPILTAESWQISNAPVIGMVPLIASLEIYDEVGMDAIRMKGNMMSLYLEYLIREYLNDVDIITPKNRGCQLSAIIPNGKDAFRDISKQGVVCDWRRPDVIRIAPHPLFNTYAEIFKFVEILKGTIVQ